MYSFNITRKQLQEIAAITKNFIADSKTTMHELEYIKVKYTAGSNTLDFVATNLKDYTSLNASEFSLAPGTGLEDFRFLILASDLQQFIKNAEGHEIKVSYNPECNILTLEDETGYICKPTANGGSTFPSFANITNNLISLAILGEKQIKDFAKGLEIQTGTLTEKNMSAVDHTLELYFTNKMLSTVTMDGAKCTRKSWADISEDTKIHIPEDQREKEYCFELTKDQANKLVKTLKTLDTNNLVLSIHKQIDKKNFFLYLTSKTSLDKTFCFPVEKSNSSYKDDFFLASYDFTPNCIIEKKSFNKQIKKLSNTSDTPGLFKVLAKIEENSRDNSFSLHTWGGKYSVKIESSIKPDFEPVALNLNILKDIFKHTGNKDQTLEIKFDESGLPVYTKLPFYDIEYTFMSLTLER